MTNNNRLKNNFAYVLQQGSRLVSKGGPLSIFYAHLVKYCTPATLTYTWSFGSLLGFYYVLQLLTGLWLTSYYDPAIDRAFESVVIINQQVRFGSIIRNMHSNGASIIFILLYLHVARGLYFRSYSYSKLAVWLSGLIILLLMMATAFIGYVLPWGQMSFWGVTVITTLLTTIPYVGNDLHAWLLGGYGVNPTTLRRFYGLHIVLPVIIGFLIGIHLYLVHRVGSTSGTQLKDDDKIGFNPYFSTKDVYGVLVSLVIFGYLVFFEPNLLGHTDNYIPANSMVTPPHIVPEWYFTPFYAILRAFPNKTAGALAMVLSLLVLGFIPLCHHFGLKTLGFVNSRYPGEMKRISLNIWSIQTTAQAIHKFFFWFFFVSFNILIYVGSQPAEEPYVFTSQIFTFFYFFYFLIIIPASPFIDLFCAKDNTH